MHLTRGVCKIQTTKLQSLPSATKTKTRHHPLLHPAAGTKRGLFKPRPGWLPSEYHETRAIRSPGGASRAGPATAAGGRLPKSR